MKEQLYGTRTRHYPDRMSRPRATYDAFVSYSHAANGKLAPAIQSALHRLARPWYRRRALRAFRDGTNLSAAPEFWPRIEQALRDSAAFILLASPEAARSKWCNKEVQFWRSKPDSGPIYVVLTDGEIVWDSDRGDFDPEKSTAIPPALFGAFASEPLWVDLRWARSDADLSLKNPRFADALATLAASLHGVDKDTLIGEDVRQHRRTRQTITATITVLVLLLAVAVGLFLYARQQLARATENLANTLAASAVTGNDGRDVAILTAIAATRIAPTWQTRAALLHLLQRNRQAVRFLYPSDQFMNVASLAISPRGQVAAKTYMGRAELWDASGTPHDLPTAGLRPLFAFADDRLLTLEEEENSSLVLRDGDATRKIPVESPAGVSSLISPLFLTDTRGATIALADGFDGDASVTVCSQTPFTDRFTCRIVKRKDPLLAAALSDDGASIALAFSLRSASATRVEVLRISDLGSDQKPITRDQDQAVSIVSEGSVFLVLFTSGSVLRVPEHPGEESPPVEVPKARFSARIIASSAGPYSAFSDALEGVGLPDVDSLIVVLDRSLPANGRLARVDRDGVALSNSGATAARVCARAGMCEVWIGPVMLDSSGMELVSASFTPDETLFVAGTKDRRVIAWNARDGSIQAQRSVNAPVDRLEIASNDRGLIQMGRHIEILNVRSAAASHSFEIRGEDPATIAAGGQVFLAHDGKAFEYDVKKAKETEITLSLDDLPLWHDGDDHEVDILAVSRDGELLATVRNMVGEGTSPKIVLRNVRTRQRPLLLSTDDRRVQAMSIGKIFLAAATDDQKIRLWDRLTGTPAALPFLARGEVARLDLLGDDSLLAVYYNDVGLETITLALPTLQRTACEIVNRDLSPDEWRLKLPSIPHEEICKAILGRPLHRRW